MPTIAEFEDINGEATINWAKQHNAVSFAALTNDDKFKQLESDALAILESKDKLPDVALSRDGYLYSFWQDDVNVRGIYRRTTIAEFKNSQTQWELLLDLDQLAAIENENWVWEGCDRLDAGSTHCLISLSRGGCDAHVIREFDLITKQFVTEGFNVAEAKSECNWIDKDTIFISTDFGADSLTESGYPSIIKIWHRGQSLAAAVEIYKANRDSVYVQAYQSATSNKKYHFIADAITFNSTYLFILNMQTLQCLRVPKPDDAIFAGMFGEKMLFTLRSNWNGFIAGSLVIMDLPRDATDLTPHVELLMTPTAGLAISDATACKDCIIVEVMENISSQVYRIQKVAGVWNTTKLNYPAIGTISFGDILHDHDIHLVTYEDFLTPARLCLAKLGESFELLKQSPQSFDATNFTVQQLHANSKDGTRVPYYILHPKNMQFDSKNPTLLYGYGGFEIPLTPSYRPVTSKNWLAAGNVYVVANIRGGGEFGPKWHQAALRENRQRAFDDFIAIAENLIARNITSPAHLGIEGGSNGGLLVAAVMVQRPELFNAVICDVPLTDMLRYHKLKEGAGASWVEEYGNPDGDPDKDPDENLAIKTAIEQYSPLQNLKPVHEVKYPQALITSSTKDDRVHPYHARIMMDRMQQLGHQAYYYENHEGGHGGAANLKQLAFNCALSVNYLFKQLCTARLEQHLGSEESQHSKAKRVKLTFA